MPPHRSLAAVASLALAVPVSTTPPACAGADGPWVAYGGGDGPGAGRHVVLVSGDEEYRSEEALPQLGRILSVRHGFRCTVLFAIDPETGAIDPDEQRNIPGLAALDDADLMIIATRFRDLPDEQMKHVDRYVRAGKPIVGLRTATHAFALESSPTYERYSWNSKTPGYEQGFGRRVLGETWVAHHGRHGHESTRGVVAPQAADHPIARGLAPGSVWGPTDVYRVRLPLEGDATPIVLGAVLDGMSPDDAPVAGEKNDPMMPVAWTRTYAGDDGTRGRVFATTMGAATDLLADGTRRMIVNGVFWALGLEDRIPAGGTDVELVGPYEPTGFGFGDARTGVLPREHALAPAAPARADGPADRDGRFALHPQERVLVVGNTFAERMALGGWLEALVQAAHPDHELVVRQVPWSADEVALRPREMNVPTMEDHLAYHGADVIVMCFGMSESFAGAAGLAAFERDLAALIDALHARKFNDERPPRLVLVSPIGHEDLGPPRRSGAAVAARNRDLAAYTDVMRRVAGSKGVRFVDLFTPSAGLYAAARKPLTINGIHPNERGCHRFVREIAVQLGWLEDGASAADGADDEGAPAAATADALRRLAWDKHHHFRLLYRATNTEYVWGRRHAPYGVVNFPPEMAQLERMVRARDRALWSIEKPTPSALFAAAPDGPAVWETVPGSRTFPEDVWSPPPVAAKGQENSLGSLTILPPEAFAKGFTVADGYVIECFASEQDFAELQNPLAMHFDERGRLWLLCAPTYPHLMPGESPRCRLLVIEDTDGDGRADRRTVWADSLYIPTGFAIDGDVVYVGQAPDLWRLTDTDGDGRADRRAIVASGFGMPDSHHTISAFEWDPNGGFLMHEGVFTKSNVETPWGTLRTRDAAVWRFDPRTERLQVLSHCSFANPWGHVFDDWGQSILADASGGDNFAFAHVIMPFEYPSKPNRTARLLHRGRPTAGCELISSRHFPDDVQGSFLVNQSIGFHGTRWDRIIPDGSAWRAESMPQDLVSCFDVNFRPVAMEIGPDGALYIVDWCNPLVGHMQYSVRDPRRDHTHGRVWRVRHAGRPLVEPPALAVTVPELLEQLRRPERNTRQHARRRLQTAKSTDVLPELARFRGRLAPDDPLHDRLVLETLWISQAHGRVDVTLLDRVAALDEPLARAGALRVLRHWLQGGVVDAAAALPILDRGVRDDDMRVRLEAVLASGFVPSVAGASVAALAGEQDMDDGLRVALAGTLAHLERYGAPQSGIARRLKLERMRADELVDLPLDDDVAVVRLSRPDVAEMHRTEALAHLAGDDGPARARRLVDVLLEARVTDDAVAAVAPLLTAMPAPDLEAAGDDLERAAASDDRRVRAVATAALVAAGREHEPLLGDDHALAVATLAHLDEGHAPAAAVRGLQAAVESGAVDPAGAVEQVRRHHRDDAELAAWLVGLVEAADGERLHAFGDEHAIAMAALWALDRTPDDAWPDGSERYRVARLDADRLERGRALFRDEIVGCARCHGIDGRGEEGFPPLDRSPWVLGRPERAAAIVVHGLHGRVELPDGRAFQSVMEPLGAALDDEQIADVLSYVRRSWGNFAPPVTAADVARGRAIKAEDGAPLDVQVLAKTYPLYGDVLLTTGVATAADRGGGVGLPRWTIVLAIGVPLAAVLVLVLILRRLDPAPSAR